jgi:DNA (cytosine-5)-methyltransferase 1
MKHIDLFSGIGGFALAARWAGYETIVFCEKDEWCQRVLAKNFGAVVADTSSKQNNGKRGDCELGRNHMERDKQTSQRDNGEANYNGPGRRGAPIIPDIHDFDGTKFTGATLLTGGFPCQPFSVAGKQRGKEDERHLWPEMLRVISQARPTWVIGENVAGFIPMELDNCLSDLEGIGYETQAFVIPACAVDAPHRRDRVWIVAHRESTERQRCGNTWAGRDGLTDGGEDVSDPCILRLQGGENPGSDSQRREKSSDKQPSGLHRSNGTDTRGEAVWEPEPNVGRVAHGIPKRVDRLKGLGNAIVPQVAYEILRAITLPEGEK